MTLVYIALGSNLASPLEQVQAAIRALGEIPHSRVVAVSSFYRTPPLGPQDQPDYLNAAVALETALPPETLLDHTQRIELQQGRVRKAERWGPRTLDLDIMLFGDAVINSERLTVPHYDMKNRGFMLWPLFEIAPDLHFPDGLALRAVLDNLGAEKARQLVIPSPFFSICGDRRNRLPKIIAPLNAAVRMPVNMTFIIRKCYETDHHCPAAEMQTGKEALCHHYRLRSQLREAVRR